MKCPNCNGAELERSPNAKFPGDPNFHLICPQCHSTYSEDMKEGDAEFMNAQMNGARSGFKAEWVSTFEPFQKIIEQIKVENKPQMKMSVVEAVFAQCLVHAISAAQAHNITDPNGMAAYITGYLSSMRVLPHKES